MKKNLTIILLIIISIAFALIGYLTYLGAFNPVFISEELQGPYTIVYKSVKGDYKKTGPIFNSIQLILKNENIISTQSLGIYYDNPAEVPKELLRSDCGSIINPADISRLTNITNDNLNIKTIPKTSSLVVEIPLLSPISYMIAPIKAYPAIIKYAKKNDINLGMAYEIYNPKNKKITIVMQKVEPIHAVPSLQSTSNEDPIPTDSE